MWFVAKAYHKPGCNAMPKRICWKNLYIPFDTFAREAVSLHKTEAGIWGNRAKIIYA